MQTPNVILAAALRDSDALICSAQEILTDFLVPGGLSKDEATNKLFDLLDGPHQREVRAFTKTALNGCSDGAVDPFGVGVTLEPVEFWCVWTKTGHVPRFAHNTEAAARREAERLARKHLGKKFIVLRAENKVHVPSTEQKEAA